MKRILTEIRTLSMGTGAVSLRYDLTAAEREGVLEYGAAVTNESSGEQAAVQGLTPDRDSAVAFFRRISGGTVTPVTLMDVAEDFVAEGCSFPAAIF